MAWWQYSYYDPDTGQGQVLDMIANNVLNPASAAQFYNLRVAPIMVTGQNSGFDPATNADVTFYPINNIYFDGANDTYRPFASGESMIYVIGPEGDPIATGQYSSGNIGIVSWSTQKDTNVIAGLPIYIGIAQFGQYGFVMGANVRPVMTPPPVDSGEITPFEGLVFVVLAATGMNFAFSAVTAAAAEATAATTSTVMTAADAATYEAIAEAALQDAAAAYAETAVGTIQTAALSAASDAAAAEYTAAAINAEAATAATEQAAALAQDAIANQQMIESAAQALEQHAADVAQVLDQQAAAAAQAIDDAQAAQAFADAQYNQELIDLSQQYNVTVADAGSSFDATVTELPPDVPSYPQYTIDYPMDPIPPGGVYVPPSPSWFEQLAAQAAKQGQSMLTSKALTAGLAAILGTRTSPPAFAKPGVIAARTVAAAPVPQFAPTPTRYIGASTTVAQQAAAQRAAAQTAAAQRAATGPGAAPVDQLTQAGQTASQITGVASILRIGAVVALAIFGSK